MPCTRAPSLISPTTFSEDKSTTLMSSPRLLPTYSRRFWASEDAEYSSKHPNVSCNKILLRDIALSSSASHVVHSFIATSSSPECDCLRIMMFHVCRDLRPASERPMQRD